MHPRLVEKLETFTSRHSVAPHIPRISSSQQCACSQDGPLHLDKAQHRYDYQSGTRATFRTNAQDAMIDNAPAGDPDVLFSRMLWRNILPSTNAPLDVTRGRADLDLKAECDQTDRQRRKRKDDLQTYEYVRVETNRVCVKNVAVKAELGKTSRPSEKKRPRTDLMRQKGKTTTGGKSRTHRRQAVQRAAPGKQTEDGDADLWRTEADKYDAERAEGRVGWATARTWTWTWTWTWVISAVEDVEATDHGGSGNYDNGDWRRAVHRYGITLVSSIFTPHTIRYLRTAYTSDHIRPKRPNRYEALIEEVALFLDTAQTTAREPPDYTPRDILPDEEFEGLDEDELDTFLPTDEEVRLKERDWVEMNRKYLENREGGARADRRARREEQAQETQDRRWPRGQAARRLSRACIDYDALRTLFEHPAVGSPALPPPLVRGQVRRGGRRFTASTWCALPQRSLEKRNNIYPTKS
ncbi:hypothetical protein PHLGIDRAFT_36108 [Phlebiopsis gigantea 11061_1 CR5-6]|uniref:Brf1 TBP-binding domain-containing protein n=1 Tax=Phlebiopsis gigantea (strain 11061_1 CR5-6) TaxID=745531 RepID=A0A0C3PJ17_PHLG1|nr:hypothetical protein PHLGIDRAFT_36108 [Phlebiopsis gigantea 11061_1 CR5-6]